MMITETEKQRLGQDLYQKINGSDWLHQSPYDQRRWIRAAVDIYLRGANHNIAHSGDPSAN